MPQHTWRSEDNFRELVLFLSRESWASHLDRWAWQQGPLPTEPSHQPEGPSFICQRLFWVEASPFTTLLIFKLKLCILSFTNLSALHGPNKADKEQAETLLHVLGK